MNSAQLFVQCLKTEGVKRIFGVPGEENAALMMALEDSDIEFVLTRHEQGAAFMADIHGRLTGEPGVCLGTLGPGATNLATGVADANMDRAPLVVITGQGGTERLHKESHQAMDAVAMYEPITKWASSIIHPSNVAEVVHKAFKLAASEKPGACMIELPEDVASMDAAEFDPIPRSRPQRPVPATDSVATAWKLIKVAKSPVVLAGYGAARKGSTGALRRFAESTGIGVINTFMAKGTIDRNSMNSLFTIGLQAKDLISRALDESDLVITVGYDMVEYPPQLWNSDCSKRIVHLDFTPAEVDENYRVEVEVVGDVASALDMLNELVENEPFSIDMSRQHAIRHEMLAEFRAHDGDSDEGPVRPQKVLSDVREFLGPKDIVLSDVGAHKMWIARHYQCDEPNTCLISNGFASMGFALPGAISAQMVYPERRVLAIAGDGGFLMNVQEMETAKRLNSNIVAMVWEDHMYGLIAWKQDNHYGRHTDLSFTNPDWKLLSESFGWGYTHVGGAREVNGALEKAFGESGPSLIVVPIDYRENGLLTERLGQIAMGI